MVSDARRINADSARFGEGGATFHPGKKRKASIRRKCTLCSRFAIAIYGSSDSRDCRIESLANFWMRRLRGSTRSLRDA